MKAVLFEMAEIVFTGSGFIIDESQLEQDLEESMRMAGVRLVWDEELDR